MSAGNVRMGGFALWTMIHSRRRPTSAGELVEVRQLFNSTSFSRRPGERDLFDGQIKLLSKSEFDGIQPQSIGITKDALPPWSKHLLKNVRDIS